MKNLFKLALRGLMRNRRRTLVTLLAIAFGFAAISLFAGYTHNVYDGLARQSIHAELLGHLTLNKRGMNKEGKLNPERYLLTATEIETISKLVKKETEVKMISPRLAFSGLVSNGRISTIFIAEGIKPEAVDHLLEGALTDEERKSGLFANMEARLDPTHSDVVNFSEGLADLLGLSIHGQAQMLVNTLTGQANVLDVTLGRAFNTGNANSNEIWHSDREENLRIRI